MGWYVRPYIHVRITLHVPVTAAVSRHTATTDFVRPGRGNRAQLKNLIEVTPSVFFCQESDDNLFMTKFDIIKKQTYTHLWIYICTLCYVRSRRMVVYAPRMYVCMYVCMYVWSHSTRFFTKSLMIWTSRQLREPSSLRTRHLAQQVDIVRAAKNKCALFFQRLRRYPYLLVARCVW